MKRTKRFAFLRSNRRGRHASVCLIEGGEKHKLQGISSKCHELLEAAIRGALGDEVGDVKVRMGGQSCRG